MPPQRGGIEEAGRDIKFLVRGVSDGGAALHVQQDVFPGIADLARNQPEPVDARTVMGVKTKAESRVIDEEAIIATAEIGPVALAFDTDHPIGELPPVTDLTTDRAAGRIMATFRH